MKKPLLFILFFSIFISCNSDNFYETDRIISTDKTEYEIGDEFEITLTIVPHKKEKEIRIYENFKNLEISFSLVNELKGIYNEDWSQNRSNLLKATKIERIIISKEKPFIKTFKGKISEKENNVEIAIPELNLIAKFSKTRFSDGTLLRIHGFCDPINPEFGASLEEYFEPKDIKIITE